MTEFAGALLRYEFLQLALVAGILGSIACGIIGAYVVVRRIASIAGGIAHCVLGGLGAARYFQVMNGWEWLHPMYGAIAAALLAAVAIGLVSLKAREREDTAIAALWALGMAAGVLFISRTPGYSQDLMSYLFGNILMVSPGDVWLIATLDAIVVTASLLFFRQLQAVCFDEEFARLRGLNVEFYYLLLLCLTALTVVMLVAVVGIVLVIALLTLPAAVAGRFSRSLSQMMLIAILLSAFLCSGGLALSYAPDLPAGATIVLLAGAVYLLTMAFGRKRRRRRT